MKMLCDSEQAVIDITKDDNDGRFFNYTLNNKRAKAKLVKGAQKEKNLDIDIRSGCVNLRFNNGSYYEVILPCLRDWNQKVDQVITIDETEAKVIEVGAGKESTGKHIDTKLVVMNGNDRLVLHAYNGTQNLMIQGKNYEHFAIDVLAPYFSSKIEESLEKIVNFNSHVKEQLGPKKSLKMKSIKPYGCPQCNVKTKTPSDLKVHMKSCHSKLGINSPKRNKIMRVLNEDISIVTVDKDLEHESVSNTKTDNLKQNKTEKDIASSVFLPLVEDLLLCSICEFDTLLQEDLNEHMSTIHGKLTSTNVPEKEKSITIEQEDNNEHKIDCKKSDCNLSSKTDLMQHNPPPHIDNNEFKCDKCGFISNTESENKIHEQTIHKLNRVDLEVADQNTIKCDQCEYKCRYVIQFKKHVEKYHVTENAYKCKQCDFATEFVADVWKHFHEVHSDASNECTKYTPKESENIVLKIVAEQTNSLMGEVASLKMETKNAMEDITATLVKCLNKINKNNDEKCKTLGNTVVKIYSKVLKLEKALDKGNKNIIEKTFEAAKPKKQSYAEIVQKVAKKTIKCKDTNPHVVSMASLDSPISAGSSPSSSLRAPTSFSRPTSPVIKTPYICSNPRFSMLEILSHTQ